MGNIFDYIVYRVFEYFTKKDKAFAISSTISFISILQITMLVPIFIIINSLAIVDLQNFGDYDRLKYYTVIPLAILLLVLNRLVIKKKLSGESLRKLREKYHKESYPLSIWVIFLAPIFFVFICPIIYGIVNGTIHFPFLEK